MQITKRDYSLVGRDTKLAEERGLANADWYACKISRQRLKGLMQRRDGPAIRDTVIWFALLFTSGVLGYLTWGTWWTVPCFVVYGVLWGSSSDSRWHECGHRTAFKTEWMNDVLYEIASFIDFRESVPWRWSHTRHHSDTIIVGRDPEIQVPRPPDLLNMALSFFNLKSAPKEFVKMVRHCFGSLTASGKDVHSRRRTSQGVPQRAHLYGDLHRRDRLGDCHPQHSAVDVHRLADFLRSLAAEHFRVDPARGAG